MTVSRSNVVMRVGAAAKLSNDSVASQVPAAHSTSCASARTTVANIGVATVGVEVVVVVISSCAVEIALVVTTWACCAVVVVYVDSPDSDVVGNVCGVLVVAVALNV